MPPGPPVRRNDGDYHFHAYDYAGSQARGPWGLSDAQPDRHGWQFYSLLRDLQGLTQTAANNQVPNFAVTDAGGPIVIGRTDRRTKQLAFGSNAANAPTVVITGGIHAREWIAPEFVYLLAEYLIMHYRAAPPYVNDYQRQLSQLINSRRIRIIPMLNPHGTNYTVFSGGGRMWRKNRRVLPRTATAWLAEVAPGANTRQPFQNAHLQPAPPGLASYNVPDYNPQGGIPPGAANFRQRTLAEGATGVDLGRNLDTAAWGYDSVPTNPYHPNYAPESDTYFGTNRGGETETGNLQAALTAAAAAVANNRLATTIDYHAFGKMILYPSGVFADDAISPDYRQLATTLYEMIRAQGLNQPPDYRLGPPNVLVGYNASGTVPDRTAELYHARAFAIELDPANTGQGTDGFDLPQTSIRMVFEKNIRAALAAIAAPAPSTTQVLAQARAMDISRAQLQYFAWGVFGRGNQLPQ